MFQGDLDFLEENRSSDLCYYLFSIVGSAVCGLGYSWGDIVLIMYVRAWIQLGGHSAHHVCAGLGTAGGT